VGACSVRVLKNTRQDILVDSALCLDELKNFPAEMRILIPNCDVMMLTDTRQQVSCLGAVLPTERSNYFWHESIANLAMIEEAIS
jgi:hypothetical protein